MILTVVEARKAMGSVNENYSDEQIEEVINAFTLASDLAIDTYIAKHNSRKEDNDETTRRAATGVGANNQEI